jgi:predicted Fe-Mo cluster-binding NifX family protein
MAASIAELKVDVLLCAALSEALRRSLEACGVRVRRHLCGDVESVLGAFLAGHLRQADFRMPGCWGWHPDGACRRRPPKDGAPDIHGHKTNTPMKIAIPVQDGRLHDHFGGCRHFAVVEIDSEKKRPIATNILPTPEHQPGAFPRWLRNLGVDTVIAGGIGRRALAIFAQHGIVVRAGSSGATVEELVAAYLGGQLKTAPDGCDHMTMTMATSTVMSTVHHEHGHHHHHHHHEKDPGEPGRSRP